MKYFDQAWFEFGGVRCEEMHLRLMAMPKRPVPAKQGEKIEKELYRICKGVAFRGGMG